MLRVLHMTESLPAAAGGTTAAFLGLMEALGTQREGLAFRAVSQKLDSADDTLRLIDPRDERWVFTNPRGRFRAGGLARGAIEQIRTFNPHVVHVHGLWCPDVVAAASAAMDAGCKVVWQPHGMLVEAALNRSAWKKRLFLALGLRTALARADAVLFTSTTEHDTSRLLMLGPSTRPAIVPLPVKIEPPEADLPRLHAEGRAKWNLGDVPVIVFVGRLHPVKRVHLSIAALAEARTAHPGTKLLLVGDGEPAYANMLRQKAAKLGVADGLVFAGWLRGDDKYRALAAADALVFNSEFENFGFAAVEAMLCHTPTVMTDNLSLARPSEAAGAGLVASSDPVQIGSQLARLITDPQRRVMGRRGRAWVEASFSAHAVGAQLADLYESLAGNQPTASRPPTPLAAAT